MVMALTVSGLRTRTPLSSPPLTSICPNFIMSGREESSPPPAARYAGFCFWLLMGCWGVLLWLSWGVDCRMVRGRVLHAPHISFVSRSSSNEAWGERTHLGVVDELDVVGVGRGLVETVGIPLVHRGQPDVLRVYVCIYVCDETYACHTHTDEGPNAATAHTCTCIR